MKNDPILVPLAEKKSCKVVTSVIGMIHKRDIHPSVTTKRKGRMYITLALLVRVV